MSESQSNNSNKSLSELSVEKVEESANLAEDHKTTLDKTEKSEEAELAKESVIQHNSLELMKNSSRNNSISSRSLSELSVEKVEESTNLAEDHKSTLDKTEKSEEAELAKESVIQHNSLELMKNNSRNNSISSRSLSELSAERNQEFIDLKRDLQIPFDKSGKFDEAELSQLRISQHNSLKFMNTSLLTNSMSSTSLGELSIERVKESIKISQDLQISLEKNGKFVEAELAKQKVIQLKQIEKELHLRDIKIKNEEKRIQFEIEQKEELENLKKNWDEKLAVLNEGFNRQEVSLKNIQQEELEKFLKNFEPNYPTYKESNELQNLKRKLYQLIKIKEYIEANNIQVKLDQCIEQEKIRYRDEKEKKHQRELDKILIKHKAELETLHFKLNLTYGEFKRNRAAESEKIVSKNQNKCKHIERAAKRDEKVFAFNTKGDKKPSNTRLTFPGVI